MAWILIVALGFKQIGPSSDEQDSLKRDIADLNRRIAEKNAEIAQVRDRRNRFWNDREFVESLARENKRAMPDEIVFQFDR